MRFDFVSSKGDIYPWFVITKMFGSSQIKTILVWQLASAFWLSLLEQATIGENKPSGFTFQAMFCF